MKRPAEVRLLMKRPRGRMPALCWLLQTSQLAF